MKSCIHINKHSDQIPDTQTSVKTTFKKLNLTSKLTEKPQHSSAMVGCFYKPTYCRKKLKLKKLTIALQQNDNIHYCSSANQIQHEMDPEEEEYSMRNQQGKRLFAGECQGSVMLVKYLSAWDEFWGMEFESPSGKML